MSAHQTRCPWCLRPISPFGLTQAERELLCFIVETFDQTGMAPSYHEMCNAVGLKSKSGINRLIVQLDRKGWIRHTTAMARGIAIIWRPPGWQAA